MEDTKEKDLHSEDLKEVSGGYMEMGWTRWYARCDKCGSEDAYPVNSGHLCKKCIEKAEKELGRKIL